MEEVGFQANFATEDWCKQTLKLKIGDYSPDDSSQKFQRTIQERRRLEDPMEEHHQANGATEDWSAE